MRKVLRKIFISMLFIPMMSSGCIYLVVGGIGAVGGYIVSPDTVEGLAEYDHEVVWNTVEDVVSIMGLIDEENQEGGVMLAKINGATVKINIFTVNQKTVKITVKARKKFLPRISIAQDIYVKIMNRLEEDG